MQTKLKRSRMSRRNLRARSQPQSWRELSFRERLTDVANRARMSEYPRAPQGFLGLIEESWPRIKKRIGADRPLVVPLSQAHQKALKQLGYPLPTYHGM